MQAHTAAVAILAARCAEAMCPLSGPDGDELPKAIDSSRLGGLREFGHGPVQHPCATRLDVERDEGAG